jgi:CDGSH-type Zn-finger protein
MSDDDVRITVCPDGPLLVRGAVEFQDEDGRPIIPNRRTVALCRCGNSAIKPWCDGTHKLLRPRTDPET